VERKKDDLLDDMGNRMQQWTEEERLFVVQWSVKREEMKNMHAVC
jgi:hypothetical protein